MTSCSVVIPELKKLFEGSKKRAESLLKAMQVTKEGEVLSQTLATAERGLEILNNGKFSDLPLVDRRGLVNSVPSIVARRHLKDVFQGAISQRANSKSARKDLVLKSAEYSDGKVKVVVTPKGKNYEWEYTFESNANVSKNTDLNGNSLFIPQFAHVYNRIEDAVREAKGALTHQEHAKLARTTLDGIYKSLDESKTTSELLGAYANTDGSVIFNYKRARNIPHGTHGSRTHMKNLLADLHGITDNSIDTKTFDYYNSLLDNMHDHFFREMNILIDENADHTAGWVDLDNNHILLNISSTWDKGMSNEEIYMHEIIHTMTAWALKQEGFEASRMRIRLNALRRAAEKAMTWQDIAKANPVLTNEQAKERFDYIFNSKNANDEFIAFALTNPAIMAQLEKVKVKDDRGPGLLNAIVGFFADLMDAVMGNISFSSRKGNVKDEIHVLAFKLAEINNKADNEVSNGGFFSKIGEILDSSEGAFEEFVTQLTDKLDKTSTIKVPENPNKLQKALFIASFFIKGVYNPEYRNMAGVLLSAYGISPTSSIREIGRNLLPVLDDAYYETEREGLRTNTIDNIRNLHNTASTRSIIKGFSKPLREDEEIALTGVLLEANGSVLFKRNKNQGKGYTTKQIAHLLSDTGLRKRTMARIEAQIRKRTKARGDWVVGQANGLGKLMATGKGHAAQLTNSQSIVKGYGTRERHSNDQQLLSAVEELGALRALDYQNASELRTVANLLSKEEKGVRNIVNLYNNFKKDSKEALFADDPSHMLEGYTKELFDDTIEVRHERIENKEELEKQGFTLVTTLDSVSGPRLGVFISKSYTQAERLRGSVGLGDPQHRGLGLRDIRYKQYGDSKKHAQVYFESDKIALNKKAREIHERLAKGESFDAMEEGPMPIMDAGGKVVDYRQMMDKRLKAKYLKQDRTVSNVLSKTTGTVLDKIERAEQNEAVLEIIKKNVREVYDNSGSDRNLEEYTLVSETSTDPEIRRLFNMLPKTYRDFANAREDKSLPIPSILMHQYFGYSHYRLTDVPGIKHLPTAIKHVINIIEAYWLDVVKIAKGNILLKMPVVLVTNIISNMLYAINTGTNPLDLVGQYRDSFRDVKAFMTAHKEVVELKIELNSKSQDYMNINFSPTELEEYNTDIKRLKDRIARLEKEMEGNEVKELFDIGMYQSVIEDVEMYKLGDTNKVSDGMDQLLNKLPTVIKTPLQVAYLSKETTWYKINQEVLQLSDLVARDVMNRKQKKIEQEQANGDRDLPLEYRRKIGRLKPKRMPKLGEKERETFLKYAKRSRHANLLDSFVNYQMPNGRGEEYLNRLGVLMFTKYLKRIQRVITSSGIKHPIRTTAMLAATGFLLDVDTIQDQALLVKGFDDNDNGVLGIVPTYSMADTILNVVTPGAVKLTPGI